MGEDSFKTLVIGSIFALLFVATMFLFVNSMGGHYGKDVTSLNTEYYNFSAINSSLDGVKTEAQRLRSIASSNSGNDGVFSLVEGFFDGVGAFFSIGFSMFGFIINLFDFVLVGTLDIIFANPLITGVIVGVVILTALFGIFRFLKQGS